MTRRNAVAIPPLPSLGPFLTQLGSLVSSPFCPPSLFLHDPKQSSILVEAILQLLDACQASEHAGRDGNEAPQVGDLLPTVARLDLAQVHSVKQALDRVLAQFSGSDLASQSTAQWDERTLGVRAWDATPLEALCVVNDASQTKKRGGDARLTQRRKRRRTGRSATSTHDESGEEASSDGDPAANEPGATGDDDATSSRWTLSWDLSHSGAGEEPARSVAPLRNSLDAFHEALRTIFAFADAHSSPRIDEPDEIQSPRRRFILLEHGELLGELAGAGKASGAARETGVGVTFASTIHRLAELTGLPITVITVSRLPWRKLRESMVGLPSPETLVFEDIASDDVVALLTDRFAASQAAIAPAEGNLNESETVQLFRSLAFIVRTTFGKVVTELDDFAYLTAKFWPRWKAVCEQSNPPIAPTDVARLSIALKSDFAAELDKMFQPRASLTIMAPSSRPPGPGAASGQTEPLTPTTSQPVGFTGRIAALPRQPSFLAPVSESPAAGTVTPSASQLDGPDAFFSSAASNATPSPVKRSAIVSADAFTAATGPSPRLAAASSGRPSTTQPSSHVALAKSLPLAARYLLIAAYFAAHNPPKSDVRMFVRVDELEGAPQKGKKAKRGGGSAKKMGRSPSKTASTTSLSGGKSFAFERMIAIFDSIVDSRLEYALGTVSISAQVNTLVQLRLLQRVSSENNADKVLDGVKLRCGRARDTVDALAVSVGWREWKERLVGEQA